MKKLKLLSCLCLLTMALGGLTSCVFNGGSTTTTTTTPTTAEPSKTTTVQEYEDTPVEAGKYTYLDIVYDFDKTNKKLKATQYATYNEYKNNGGTVLFNLDAKYVDYEGKHAVYVNYDNVSYYIYVDEAKTKISIKRNTATRSSGMVKLGTIIEPEYGTYVSDKLEQDKLGEDGKRIPNGDGGYVKEEFYLFVELTATTAKLFVGSNATTHKDTPLYSINNYQAKFLQGNVIIEIPHTTAGYSCNLIVLESNVLEFTNDSEDDGTDARYSNYSGSGNMRKIS